MECIRSILSDKRICSGSKNSTLIGWDTMNELRAFQHGFLCWLRYSYLQAQIKKKNLFVWCFYLCHFHFVFSGQAFENIKQTGKVGTKNADSVVSMPPTFFWRENEVKSKEPFENVSSLSFNTTIPDINIDWLDNIFETLLFIRWYQTQLWSWTLYLSFNQKVSLNTS